MSGMDNGQGLPQNFSGGFDGNAALEQEFDHVGTPQEPQLGPNSTLARLFPNEMQGLSTPPQRGAGGQSRDAHGRFVSSQHQGGQVINFQQALQNTRGELSQTHE